LINHALPGNEEIASKWRTRQVFADDEATPSLGAVRPEFAALPLGRYVDREKMLVASAARLVDRGFLFCSTSSHDTDSCGT
jgi:hypothetical protein